MIKTRFKYISVIDKNVLTLYVKDLCYFLDFYAQTPLNAKPFCINLLNNFIQAKTSSFTDIAQIHIYIRDKESLLNIIVRIYNICPLWEEELLLLTKNSQNNLLPDLLADFIIKKMDFAKYTSKIPDQWLITRQQLLP